MNVRVKIIPKELGGGASYAYTHPLTYYGIRTIYRMASGVWFMDGNCGDTYTLDEATARMYLRGEASPVLALMRRDR